MWAYWLPHSRAPSPFPTGSFGIYHRSPSPLTCASGSSSRTLRSSTKYFYSQSAKSSKAFSAFLGVCGPSSRHQPSASVLRVFQHSSPFRPRRFSRPRRFPPRLALKVYFTLLPRPGFTLQGFLPRSQPHHLSMIVALSSLSRLCYRQLPTCSTPSVLALRAFIRVRIRDPMCGV